MALASLELSSLNGKDNGKVSQPGVCWPFLAEYNEGPDSSGSLKDEILQDPEFYGIWKN